MSLLKKPSQTFTSNRSIRFNFNPDSTVTDYRNVLKPSSPHKINEPFDSNKLNTSLSSPKSSKHYIRNPKLSSSPLKFDIKDDSHKSETLSLEDQKYQLKQKYLKKLKNIQIQEQEINLSKFELKEIECELEEINRKLILKSPNKPNDFFNQAFNQTEKDLKNLKLDTSKQSHDQLESPLKIKTSYFINSAIDEFQQIQKKASTIFNDDKENNNTKSSLPNIFKNSNNKIGTLSKQTSQFFNDTLKQISPSKEQTTNIDEIDEFDIDHLNNDVQVLYENIDIDEYNSSFED
ncbi:uncharacterized protein KGF55_003401 [Candida pseudojiufengensis]|uniref:uncharacterized protein n=1 Tax=Candida pseudojiufengensis TaxID=497109 RepID=UPI002224BAAD|nr:uncharacterized protein KGF55_003401 [Candida pseudojiufengensis]KAI5962325.1 hypothetical protein KGF55_003401 [Candida pseudojiufengensis]